VRQLEQATQELQLPRRVPGFQYVVVNAESILVDCCGGYAELPLRPMTLDTTMMAYSMSKTVTASAVLQLVETGRIGLEDAVSRYVPWQPYGDLVTVRGLLDHTAGLPNPIPLRWVHPAGEHLLFDEAAALRTVLSKHSKLASPPAMRFAYSNIGYWLLGSLIENVASESFSSYVTNHVFAPLDLNANEMAYVIPDARRHASGYLERLSLFNLVKPLLIDSRLIGPSIGRWVSILSHYPNGPSFGGIVGTARAFGRFLQDQLRDRSKLLGEAARARFTEQQRTARGTIPMTLGWHMGSLGPNRYFYKEGGGAGFRSMMRLYRSHGIGSVFMANATKVDVGRTLDHLDGQLVPVARSSTFY